MRYSGLSSVNEFLKYNEFLVFNRLMNCMTLHVVFLKLISQRKLNIDIQIYGNLGKQDKKRPKNFFFPSYKIKTSYYWREITVFLLFHSFENFPAHFLYGHFLHIIFILVKYLSNFFINKYIRSLKHAMLWLTLFMSEAPSTVTWEYMAISFARNFKL